MKGYKDTSKTVWIAGGYAKGGAVTTESTPTRSAKIPLSREVATPAERGAIERGNRAAALEASERAVMSPRVRRGVPVAPREPLIGKACGGSPRKK